MASFEIGLPIASGFVATFPVTMMVSTQIGELSAKRGAGAELRTVGTRSAPRDCPIRNLPAVSGSPVGAGR
jgi:hypothetical protein